MRKPLVIGNWKMHGAHDENRRRLRAILSGVAGVAGSAVDMAVCAPFPYLGQMQDELRGGRFAWGGRLAWGAQNVSPFSAGAYTGEVAPGMLADFGCTYVLVGHSERRSLFHEDDALVAVKAKAALANGVTPVLCLGESLEEWQQGRTDVVVERQLGAVMDAIGTEQLQRLVIAYEPVWAIGTGNSASPELAQVVHEFIRAQVALRSPAAAASIRILYGGSVKAANAAQLFAMADIDGGLIGGASLVADEFIAICQAAASETIPHCEA